MPVFEERVSIIGFPNSQNCESREFHRATDRHYTTLIISFLSQSESLSFRIFFFKNLFKEISMFKIFLFVNTCI